MPAELATEHSTLPLRQRAPWRVWLGEHAVLVAAVVFFTLYSGTVLRRGRTNLWFDCFARAADRMVRHQPIHHHERDAYAYPPFMALASVPLAQLPGMSSLLAYYALNAAAGGCAIALAWRLAGAPSLVALPRRWWLVLAAGLVIGFRYLLAPLDNVQPDLILAALVMAGVWLLWHGRDLRAAVCLGTATAMKCTPLLFAPYLVWRGRPRAALLLVAVAVGLNLLPDLLFPQASGRSYVSDWRKMFLGGVAHSAPGDWHSDLVLNQSLGGLVQRYYRWGLATNWRELAATQQPLDAVTARRLQLVVLSIAAGLVALTACYGGRPWRRAAILGPEASAPIAWSQQRTPIEAGAIVVLMLLLSPMSGKAHYAVLFLPIFLICRLHAEQRGWAIRLLAIALWLSGPLVAKDLLGKTLGDLLLAWGVTTWFAIFCWLGMGLALARSRRDEQTAAPSASNAPVTSRAA
ncbi:MAG: glycosyltransferase family 87 protein [Pirellulales bacterium]